MNSEYEMAKSTRSALEENLSHAKMSMDLIVGDNRLGNGLVPDHIRAKPEWQNAKREYDLVFSALRKFNQAFVRKFKRDIMQERRARYGQ